MGRGSFLQKIKINLLLPIFDEAALLWQHFSGQFSVMLAIKVEIEGRKTDIPGPTLAIIVDFLLLIA